LTWCLVNGGAVLEAYAAAGGPPLGEDEFESLFNLGPTLDDEWRTLLGSPPAMTNDQMSIARDVCRQLHESATPTPT
jgi:hypothetical protein